MNNSSALASLVLPNGLTVKHDRASQDTPYVFKEVFEERVYLRHGIELHDDATLVDVGGHIGLFSLYALTHHARIKVYVFEPMPRTRAALTHNLQSHAPAGSSVKIFDHGISDRERQVEFSYYPSVPGHSTMFPNEKGDVHRTLEEQVAANPWEHNKALAIACVLLFPLRRVLIHQAIKYFFRAEKVPTRLRPLSDVIDEQQIEKIDLLKVDVEDAELDVLRGIREEHWPRIRQAVVELGADKGRVQTVQKLLEAHGLKCAIERDPVTPELDAYVLFARRA